MLSALQEAQNVEGSQISDEDERKGLWKERKFYNILRRIRIKGDTHSTRMLDTQNILGSIPNIST